MAVFFFFLKQKKGIARVKGGRSSISHTRSSLILVRLSLGLLERNGKKNKHGVAQQKLLISFFFYFFFFLPKSEHVSGLLSRAASPRDPTRQVMLKMLDERRKT